LRVLVKLYEQAAAGTDFVSVCQCLMFLDDAPAAAALLERLIDGSEARFLATLTGGASCGRLR
jgi:26S proteasome regulatory subunit N2